MRLQGATKGTELEQQINQLYEGEARGAGLYYALAFLAQEKGHWDIVETLHNLANDEARHAGLYAFLNGQAPDDIFSTLKHVAQLEEDGFEKINTIAQHAHSLGLDAVAKEIEIAALDEKRHGEILTSLVANRS